MAADRQYREPWFLIGSAGLTPAAWPAARIVAAYGQRWTTEECFKDEKNDSNEGFHRDCVRLTTPARWDRLLWLFAWTYYWQSVAGTLVEAAGQDRHWRANTVRTHRTHALWRLGVWAFASGAITWRPLRQAPRRGWATILPIVGSAHGPDTASAVHPGVSARFAHIRGCSATRAGAAYAWVSSTLHPGPSGHAPSRQRSFALAAMPGAG
jgi:hypothetical protein